MKTSSSSLSSRESPVVAGPEAHSWPRWLLVILWLVAIALGAFQAWADRYTMNADGISYLDMGNAYVHGEWGTVINAYWSPLYSWLLGLALLALKPMPYWEFPVVHLVNYVVYLGALGCFHFFWSALIHYKMDQTTRWSEERHITLPVWGWLVLGYTLFMWSSLVLITLSVVTPDMCVAACVYLASGILLHIYRGSAGWLTFVLLGVVLGCGYLAKAPMFPLAFIFLAVSAIFLGNFWRAVPRVLIASVVFLALSSLLITALSMAKGRLTFGDSAKLSYARYVNGAANRHWQGVWPPGMGVPQHPTREIFGTPAVYEFGSPVGGTYPPWYDPSYWNEGIVPFFEVRGQLRALAATAETYFNIFFPSQCLLLGGFLPLLVQSRRQWPSGKVLAPHWILSIPAIVALGMYSLVYVEARYIGAFVVIVWGGVAASVRLHASQASRTFLAAMLVVILTILLCTIEVSIAPKISSAMHDLIKGQVASAPVQWQIADGLNQMGVLPGDQIAIIGQGTPRFSAYWARLARVRIVAEIPSTDVREFWEADDLLRSQVIHTLSTRTGAKVAVAENLPSHVSTVGWQRIGATDHFAYFFRQKAESR